MGTGFEESLEVLCGLREHAWSGDADAVETECAGLAGERSLELCGRALGAFVQKSRST
jgi:hypothetical protein